MPTFKEVYDHIKTATGCSQKRAHASARRCYFDPQWAYLALSVELYHGLYPDPTGEEATAKAAVAA